MRLEPDDLRALALPTDLLEAFPEWRRGSRAGFRPQPLRAAPLAAGANDPLPTLRLHVSPATGTAPLVLTLVRDLLRHADPHLRIAVLVDPHAPSDRLQRLARHIIGPRRRVTFAIADFGTIFARDNAVAALDHRGSPALIVPRALRTPIEAAAAPLDARATSSALGVRIVRSRLYWHGGNLLNDGQALAVGADTIAENAMRLGLAPAEVIAILEAEQRRPAIVLGQPRQASFDAVRNTVTPSAQASYHIDLDVVLLGLTRGSGPPVALVADPLTGSAFVPDVLRLWADRPPPHLPRRAASAGLAREVRLANRRRVPLLREYRETLARAGYRVHAIPEVRTRGWLDDDAGFAGRDLSYCNVVPGRHRGRAAVYYVPWGVPPLDRAAADVFRRAGVRPIALSRRNDLAALMMDRAAGLRCFVGA